MNNIISFLLGVTITFAIIAYMHPYQECKRKYDTVEDLAECIWILEND